jgi:membrane carboxypeptidase/penicillin-binding protein PbpC
VTDGALVAIRPTTGEILAMVGSQDFYNEAISGQVNMAVSPRQPGSSIKPLTYVAAFEKGWTPSTLIWDVPSEFPPSGRVDDTRPPYKPVNYDSQFHGPVTVRTALANSYNIPAVKTLDFVGIYDNPSTPDEEGLISFAKRLGITSLTRPDYGLSLTLGGGEVSLLELTGAYATFANGGRRVPPVAITRILDYAGNVIYDHKMLNGDQVVRPEHAYLITSILSDNEARSNAFGRNSVLNLPFAAAVKTGTTNDFRDNWTEGYTPDLAVGVWVGNADFTPMQHTTGIAGAAPIWAEFMKTAIQQLTGGNPTSFIRPAGIVDQVVCKDSGTFPSEWCPEQYSELFAADQPPLPKENDLWQKIKLDTWTGLGASEACPDFTSEEFVLNVKDPWAIKWIKKDPAGQKWANNLGFSDPILFTPERNCKADDPHPIISFTTPRENETIISNQLVIYGTADATDWFDYFTLEYGQGDDPVEWHLLERSKDPIKQSDQLYEWNTSDIPEGIITLRLTVYSIQDTKAEKLLHLNMQVPTPTPPPTITPTFTPVPSATPMPSPTILPTLTYTPLPPPTQTPLPPPPPTVEIIPTETSILPPLPTP